MNKTQRRLFGMNFLFILFFLFFLAFWWDRPFSDYGILFLGAIGLAYVLTLLFSLIFLNPIRQMQSATEKMTKGDFQTRLPLGRQDELGDLAENVHQISQDLQINRKEFLTEATELKVILSSMTEGVIVFDKNDRIQLLNEQLSRLLGVEVDKAIGRAYWEVVRHSQINTLFKEAILTRQPIKKEIELLGVFERFFILQASPVFINAHEFDSVVAVFYDISELKKLERVRIEFFANISHELKTPLTLIKGYLETLDEAKSIDQATTKSFIKTILKNTQRLERLVDDLLTLSALESKAITLHSNWEDIHVLLDEVIDSFEHQLKIKKINVVKHYADQHPLVWVDAKRIEQVLMNLISNAIKFSLEHQSIIVTTRNESQMLWVDIKDSGIGIAAEHLPRIFERFYRIPQQKPHETQGTGLGLAIVKHIIQAHGGAVLVESQPQQGSSFSFSLPIEKTSNPDKIVT